MKANKIWIPIFLAPAMILFLIVYVVPLIMVFGTSLFNYKLYPSYFEFVGFGNYISLLSDDTFIVAFKNTITWILIQCTLHVGLGVLLALILYKKPFGWKFVRVTYMIPNIISTAAIAMIFTNIFNPSFGVVNSVLNSLGLEQLTHNWLFESSTAFASVSMTWMLFAGYTTTLVLAEALSLDESVLEAARIDGASNLQLDLFVVLPLIKRMIGTTTIMAASYMLQMFDLIYITTNGGPGTTTMNLPLMLYRITVSETNYGYANTIGVVIIIVGMVCMTFINKLFKMDQED